MSKNLKRDSSTSTRSVKSRTRPTVQMPQEPDSCSMVSVEPEVLVSSNSPSRLEKSYDSKEFRIAWDNEVGFHVARNLLLLRKYRETSQAKVAISAGTSQSKIARIESGSENITLRTLRRLITALGGRFDVSISPEELSIPRMPAWWEWTIATDHLQNVWRTMQIVIQDDGFTKRAGAVWQAPSTSEEASLEDESDWLSAIPTTKTLTVRTEIE